MYYVTDNNLQSRAMAYIYSENFLTLLFQKYDSWPQDRYILKKTQTNTTNLCNCSRSTENGNTFVTVAKNL